MGLRPRRIKTSVGRRSSGTARAVGQAGETELHKLLKREACRWMFSAGYRAIAAEVKLEPLGIIDAVGTGTFGQATSHFHTRQAVHQVCFIECKASRGDFLRDLSSDGQLELALMERAANKSRRSRKRRSLRQRVGLGKFDACLAQPMANLHYILAPAGLLKKEEIPRRWGLLSWSDAGIAVVLRPVWQVAHTAGYVESAIARALTCDIYKAGDRAMDSVNRTLMNQQAQLAEKIRTLKSSLNLEGLFVGTAQKEPGDQADKAMG